MPLKLPIVIQLPKLKLPSNEHIRSCLANYAPIACSIMLIGCVVLLWKGGWSAESEARRVDIIGLVTIILTILMGLGLFYLWRLVLGDLSIKAGAVEISAEVDRDQP